MDLLSEQRSRLRAAAGGTWGEWSPGLGRGAVTLAVLGGVASRRHGFWLTGFPSAASPSWCMGLVVSVLCPSDAHLPLVTLEVAQLGRHGCRCPTLEESWIPLFSPLS